jgi:hypothetical protein
MGLGDGQNERYGENNDRELSVKFFVTCVTHSGIQIQPYTYHFFKRSYHKDSY